MARPLPQSTALYTAIVTPFGSEGKIRFPELERLLRDQERAENGVVILGSTGEGLALSEEEKREVVRFTSALGLRIPVLAGVSGFQLPQALAFLQFCEKQTGIDGYLMPVPLYAKPGLEGQAEWFAALLRAVSRPSMIYNIPSRTGVKLRPEALTRLSGHPRLWAVKESSGSVEEFQSYLRAAPSLRFYCGDDALLPSFAAKGAVGLVSVAGNVWPVATHRYVDLCLAGKGEAALSVWQPACDSLFSASNPVPAKALLRLQGRIADPAVRPPLSEKDLAGTTTLAAMDKAVEAWHAKL
jgi:4-hydroxy-tetrahydrodipicolinate synthase